MGGILRNNQAKFNLAEAKEEQVEAQIGGKGMVCVRVGTFNPEAMQPERAGTQFVIEAVPSIRQVIEAIAMRIPYVKSESSTFPSHFHLY